MSTLPSSKTVKKTKPEGKQKRPGIIQCLSDLTAESARLISVALAMIWEQTLHMLARAFVLLTVMLHLLLVE